MSTCIIKKAATGGFSDRLMKDLAGNSFTSCAFTAFLIAVLLALPLPTIAEDAGTALFQDELDVPNAAEEKQAKRTIISSKRPPSAIGTRISFEMPAGAVETASLVEDMLADLF